VRELFKKAKQAAPAILFLDEMDGLIPNRSSHQNGVAERVISQFLTEMDGIEDIEGVMVLAATNRIDLIDPALLRSGRFDLIFELPEPDRKTRENIFAIHTRNKPLADNIDLSTLAEKTENMVGADIEFICRKAAMLAIRQFIQNNEDIDPENMEQVSIGEHQFNEAIQLVKDQKINKKF